MKSYKYRAEKIEYRIEQLATYSDDQEQLSRLFGTTAFTRARDTIASWMKEAGLQTSVDNIGNVRGKLVSKKHDAKTFVIGSHFDTIVNAGKYDGTLGLLAGLDLMERRRSERGDRRTSGCSSRQCDRASAGNRGWGRCGAHRSTPARRRGSRGRRCGANVLN